MRRRKRVMEIGTWMSQSLRLWAEWFRTREKYDEFVRRKGTVLREFPGRKMTYGLTASHDQAREWGGNGFRVAVASVNPSTQEPMTWMTVFRFSEARIEFISKEEADQKLH